MMPKTSKPNSKQKHKSSYKPKYAALARKHCARGATITELGKILGCSDSTIGRWQRLHPEFREAVQAGWREHRESEHVKWLREKLAAAPDVAETPLPAVRRAVIILPDNGRD
jgi:hypothetical protein